MATARETCACGATIRIEEVDYMALGSWLTEWRKDHRHEMSVAKTVGDVSMRLGSHKFEED